MSNLVTNSLPLPVLDASQLGAHRASTLRTANELPAHVSLAGHDGLDERVGFSEQAGLRSLPVLTDTRLFDACGVRIAFTSREGGVSEGSYASLNCAAHVGDSADCVEQNRAILLEALASTGDAASDVRTTNPASTSDARTTNPASASDADTTNPASASDPHTALSLLVPSQVHGTNLIELIDATNLPAARADAMEGADGLIVRVPRVAALLNFADCLPLVLVAPSGDFAVVHAGWRGAVAHIASKAVIMLAPDSTERAGMNAYVGPYIHHECFEVGEEVVQQFKDEFPAHTDAIIPDANHVNLFQAVRADLLSAGLDSKRIVDANICTMCHPDEYFSYRASQGTCGRHSAVAVRM